MRFLMGWLYEGVFLIRQAFVIAIDLVSPAIDEALHPFEGDDDERG